MWEYYLLGFILLPGILLAMYASIKVNTTYSKYSRVASASGLTAAQVAELMLRNAGLYDVRITCIGGNLTDHFDPRTRTLALSQGVYHSTSVAAIGVAAHEVGHAIQHSEGYVPLKLRSAMVPVINISSRLLWPILIIGLLFTFLIEIPLLGDIFLIAGLVVFGGSLIFSLVTLPVEFNASSRAYRTLIDNQILSVQEANLSKKVLNAAALTYVAYMVMALLNLLRFLLIFGRHNNR